MAKEAPVPVSFSKKQMDMINRFKGEFGDSEPEIIRTIVVMWLFQNSFLDKTGKKNERQFKN